MSPLTRRRTLQLAGASMTAAVAGCLGSDSATDTRLEMLRATNFTAESHTLTVEITTDGETRYQEAVDIDAAQEEESVDGSQWGEAAFDGYPTSPDAYVIHSWRGDQSREDGSSVDLTEYDYECVQVDVHIGDPFRDDIEDDVSLWRSFDCPDDA